MQTDEQRAAEIEREVQRRVADAVDGIDARLPLSDSEVAELRAMLLRDGRVQWLWSTARTLAIWVAAIVAGVTVGYDALRSAVRSLSQ